MHGINLIRENPAAFDEGLRARGLEPRAEALLDLDQARRHALTVLQNQQSMRNELSTQIGAAMKARQTDEADRLKAEVGTLKQAIEDWTERAEVAQTRLRHELEVLPNLPAADVPLGKDETANHPEAVWEPKGGRREIANPKPHWELGEALGMMDFRAGTMLAGPRTTVLKGPLAKLARGLGNWMIDHMAAIHGYTETDVPCIVNREIMYGTGQLPKFEADAYRLNDADQYLIPTAEVPLTNLVRDQIVDEDALPLKYVALTPCFRKEAGSAGRDVRGMMRQHQFMKCELVVITTPERSEDEHTAMLMQVGRLLQLLELPHRHVKLCTGDMGFSAKKTYDFEVWLPSQNAYREISSVSNCGDFQARRMNARYRKKDGSIHYLHTLNGSAVAVGRALIAVMENYQNPDGSITVPDQIMPYVGFDKIKAGWRLA
jgi:seryl-tRNA synthetase